MPSAISQRPREAAHLATIEDRAPDQQPSDKRAAATIDLDPRVFEAQPAAGEREPGLVDGLLDAEQQPVPARRRDPPRRAQPAPAAPQAGRCRPAARPAAAASTSASTPIAASPSCRRHRAGPVAVAVGDAADDSLPARAAPRAVPAGSPAAAMPSCAERIAGAGAGGGELAPALLHRAGDDLRLALGKRPTSRRSARLVATATPGGQDPLKHRRVSGRIRRSSVRAAGQRRPLPRIAKRDLLEADAVVPGRARECGGVRRRPPSARKRRCQSAVESVPHHWANSGWRSTRVGSTSRGKWLTSTAGSTGSTSASRRLASATRASHQASRLG